MRRLLTLLIPMLSLGSCYGAEAPPRDQLGREIKLTILVDKVMQPENGWVTEEWMLKETAEAGFNVYSPRLGYDNLEAVRQVTDWGAKYGLYHLPWMRGTLAVPAGAEADGKRLVWANGTEQALWSPNAAEFWDWTTQYIVEYAKISVEHPNLMGVFLDYENYAPGRSGNCYELSYDRHTLDRFAAAQQVTIPEPALDARQPWLVEQGLHHAFEAWQVNLWREKCRELRQAVDRHNPAFQFCIYPAPGTKFMLEAATPEWSTAAAPIILADPWTYGRPSRFVPQPEALAQNRKILEQGLAIVDEIGVPYIYVGGIDPVVKGADPEFSGKNAVLLSQVTDGYWIFYEGPSYKTDHRDYFKWFTWANDAIIEGRFEVWEQPRETPEDWSLKAFGAAGAGAVAAPAVTGRMVDFGEAQFRGENLFLIAGKAGQPVEISAENLKIGSYIGPLIWQVKKPDLTNLAEGRIAEDETGTIRFTPPADGLYLLGASAGARSYRFHRANAPVSVFASDSLTLILAAERFYFQVPAGSESFTIDVTTAGFETARINVFGPDGEQVETGQTTPTESKLKMDITVGEAGPGVWSLAVAKADQGALDDVKLKFSGGVTPVLSLSPEHVFGMK